ncbi:MAG: hypothetical protein K940chlam2_00180 [Chlamydiae bacterium]|nr:hypothetical protein [Chlamydiota bacterium]
MRYLMTPQQTRFFSEHGTIDFDPLISDEDLHILEEALKTHPSGRDLFRHSEGARKILCSKKFGEIGAALFNETPLMVAYTQYPFAPVEEEVTLEFISSFSDLAGAVLLNTEQSIFVAPTHPLPPFQGVLIAYGSTRTRYKINTLDPKGHELKKLGFGSGDRLKAETHPIVARK